MEKPILTKESETVSFVYHCSKINPTFTNFFVLNNEYSRYICMGCFENCYKGKGLINSLVKTEAICSCLLDGHKPKEIVALGRNACEIDIRLFYIESEGLYLCSHCLLSKPELFNQEFLLDEAPNQKCACSNDIALNIHMKMLYKSGKSERICLPQLIFELLSNANNIYSVTFSYNECELDINAGANMNFWTELLKTLYTFGPHFDLVFNQLNQELQLGSFITTQSYFTALKVCESKLRKNEYAFALFDLVNLVVFEQHFDVRLEFEFIAHLSPSLRTTLLRKFKGKVAAAANFGSQESFEYELKSILEELMQKKNPYISKTIYLFILCMSDEAILDLIESFCKRLMLLFHTENLTIFETNVKEVYPLLYLRFLDIVYLKQTEIEPKRLEELRILITSGSVSFTEKKDRDFGFSVLLINYDYHQKIAEQRERQINVGLVQSLQDRRLDAVKEKQADLRRQFSTYLSNKMTTSDFLGAATNCLLDFLCILELPKFSENETEDFIDNETNKLIFFKELKHNTIPNSLSNELKLRIGLFNGFCRDLLDMAKFLRCDKVKHYRIDDKIEEMRDNLLALICHILESISEECYEVALYVHQELIKIKRDFDFEPNLHILMYKQIMILTKQNDVFSKNIKHYSLGDKFDSNDLDGPFALYFKDKEYKISEFIITSLNKLQDMFSSTSFDDDTPLIRQIGEYVSQSSSEIANLLKNSLTEEGKQDIFDELFQVKDYSKVEDNNIACLLVLSVFFDLKLEYDKKYRLLDRDLKYLKESDKLEIDKDVIEKLSDEPRIDTTFRLNMIEFFFRYNEETFENTCSFNIIAKTMNLSCLKSNSFQLLNIDSIEHKKVVEGKMLSMKQTSNIMPQQELDFEEKDVIEGEDVDQEDDENNFQAEEEKIGDETSFVFKLNLNNIFEMNHARTFEIYSEVIGKVLCSEEHRAEFLCDVFVQYARTIRVFVVNTVKINRDPAKDQIRKIIKQFFDHYEIFLEKLLRSESCKFHPTHNEVFLNDFLDFSSEGRSISFKVVNLEGLRELKENISTANQRLDDLGIFDTKEYLALYRTYSDFRDTIFSSSRQFDTCMPIEFRTTDFLYNKNDVYEELIRQIFTELDSRDITYIKVEKVLIELNSLMENEGEQTTTELFRDIKHKLPFLITKLYILVLDYLKFIENDFYNEQQDVIQSIIVNLFAFIKHLNDNNNKPVKQFFAELEIDFNTELWVFDQDKVNSGLNKVGVFKLFSAIIESITSYLLTEDSFLVSSRNKSKLSEVVDAGLTCLSEILEGATTEHIDMFFSKSSIIRVFHESEKSRERSFLKLFENLTQTGVHNDYLQKSYLTFFNGLAGELRISPANVNLIQHNINPEMALNMLTNRYENILIVYGGEEKGDEGHKELIRIYKKDYTCQILNTDDFRVAFMAFDYISTLAYKGVKRAKILLDNKFMEKEAKKQNRVDVMQFNAVNFFKTVCRSVEVFIDNELKTVFFPLEPKLFLLLPWSKRKFIEEVNRENSVSKKLSILEYWTYFREEIDINADLVNFLGWFNWLIFYNMDINLSVILTISFFVNLSLFTSINTFDIKNETYRNDSVSVNLSIQMVTCLLGFIFWFPSRFRVTYAKIRNKYCYRFNKKPESLTFYERFYMVVVDSLLLNKYFLTFTLIFITSASSLAFLEYLAWLPSFQMLLIAVVSKNLRNIIQAVYLRKGQLFLSTVYILIMIYIYSALTFYYFSAEFKAADGVDDVPICSESVECFVNMIDYGLRMGGGIGDSFSVVKWREDYYWTRFTLSFTFYFIIILIMLNIVSGIIIDTFSDLREQAAQEQFDIENICLICGNNKAEIVKEEGSFTKHIEEKHNVFNYFLFMIYLNKKNKLELNEVEGYVLAQMHKNDVDWMPDAEEKEENEEIKAITDEVHAIEDKINARIDRLIATVDSAVELGARRNSIGNMIPKQSSLSNRNDPYFEQSKAKRENKSMTEAEKQKLFLSNLGKRGNEVYTYLEGKFNDLEQVARTDFEKFIDLCFTGFRQVYNSSALNSLISANIMKFADKSFLNGDEHLPVATQRYAILVEILNNVARKMMRDVFC